MSTEVEAIDCPGVRGEAVQSSEFNAMIVPLPPLLEIIWEDILEGNLVYSSSLSMTGIRSLPLRGMCLIKSHRGDALWQ
jgi:hypothetical protein